MIATIAAFILLLSLIGLAVLVEIRAKGSELTFFGVAPFTAAVGAFTAFAIIALLARAGF